MALRNRGEVPFPFMGDGRFICFTLADIGELEQKYGVGEYLATIDANIQEGSGSTVLTCLQIGLKERKDGKRVRVGFDADDLDFAITDVHRPIMDALCLAIGNKDYGETMEELAKAAEKLREANAQAEEEAEKKEDPENPLPVSGASPATKQ